MDIFNEDSDSYLTPTQKALAQAVGVCRPRYQVLDEIFSPDSQGYIYTSNPNEYGEIIIFIDLEFILLKVLNNFTFDKITPTGLDKHPHYLAFLIISLIGHYRNYFATRNKPLSSIIYMMWPIERPLTSIHQYGTVFETKLHHNLYSDSREFNPEWEYYVEYVKNNLSLLFKCVYYIPNCYNIRDGYNGDGIDVNPYSFIQFFINNSDNKNILIIDKSNRNRSYLNNRNKIMVFNPNKDHSKLLIQQFDHYFKKESSIPKDYLSFIPILNNIENSINLYLSMVGDSDLGLPPSIENKISKLKIFKGLKSYFDNTNTVKMTSDSAIDFINHVNSRDLLNVNNELFYYNWLVLDKDQQLIMNYDDQPLKFQIILDNLYSLSNPHYLSELSSKVFSQHDLDIQLLTSGV